MQFLERGSRPFFMLACLSFLGLVGLVDYLTGFEMFFSVFYLLGVGWRPGTLAEVSACSCRS